MPDDVREALTAAYAQHEGSSPSESAPVTPPPSSTDVKTTSPASGTGPVSAPSPPSSTVQATTPPSGEDDDLKDAGWLDLNKRRILLQNAREKERTKAIGDLKTRLGLDPTDPNVVANIQAFFGNPKAYVQRYGATWGLTLAEATPVATPKTSPAPQTFERPKPSLLAQDGVTAAYDASAIDTLLGHYDGVLAELKQHLAPLQQTHADLQEERLRAHVERNATRTYEAMQKWPGFEELRPKIGALMQQSWDQFYRGEISQDQILSAESAYRQVVSSDYLPSLEGKIRQNVLAELAKTPSVPKGTTPATPTRGTGDQRKGGMTAREALAYARSVHGVS